MGDVNGINKPSEAKIQARAPQNAAAPLFDLEAMPNPFNPRV
jgi:hypothetical protein